MQLIYPKSIVAYTYCIVNILRISVLKVKALSLCATPCSLLPQGMGHQCRKQTSHS